MKRGCATTKMGFKDCIVVVSPIVKMEVYASRVIASVHEAFMVKHVNSWGVK